MVDPLTALGAIFQAKQLTEAIAGILGIVEPPNRKIARLTAKDFDTGVRHLRDLLKSKKQRDYFLTRAHDSFQSAIVMETGVRKAQAYIAAAFCQHRMEETELAISTLEEFLGYDFVDRGARNKKRLALAAHAVPILPFAGPLVAVAATIFLTTGQGQRVAKGTKIAANVLREMNDIPSEQDVKQLQSQTKKLIRALKAER